MSDKKPPPTDKRQVPVPPGEEVMKGGFPPPRPMPTDSTPTPPKPNTPENRSIDIVVKGNEQRQPRPSKDDVK